MLKLMAGIHFGGIATAERKPIRDHHSFPLSEVLDALCFGNVPVNAGLLASQNTGLVQRSHISIGGLIDISKSQMIGVQVQFGPIYFETTIFPLPTSIAHHAGLAVRRRPSIIDFVGTARDARVVLTWDRQTNEVNYLAIGVRPEDLTDVATGTSAERAK